MDPLSQGLAGAVVPQSFSAKKEMVAASIAGFVAGMLADLDILIYSAEDPLLSLEYHRHFSHALIFIPIGGLIAALLVWPFLKQRYAFPKILLFSTAGYATCGLLDACTSYGTHLLWPFSDQRVSWDNIAIVDPVFTGILGLMVGLSFFKKDPLFARIGLAFAILYLLAGAVQRERAEGVLLETAKSRGHSVESIRMMPTVFNLVLWRGIYESGGNFHVDAVRVGIFSGVKIYPGESVKKFQPDDFFPGLPKDSVLYRDIKRFTHFSGGFAALHPDNPRVLGDIRYSLLPHRLEPLWGIEISPEARDRHVPLIYFRSFDRKTLEIFLNMLRGV
ncbi:metal-dependent hydrolase [Desulfococcaceae bacterium HSG8]|nr:metal-dependent hydrolase [Desulfococcaceae bacterium HSG8]